MKKNLFIALALLLAAPSITVFAAEPNANCTANGRECNRNRSHCDASGNERCLSPFEGLALTAEQQKSIESLGKQCKEKKDAGKAERQGARQECRKEWLAKVKEILTPEQYVAFLENSVLKADGHRRGAHHGGKMHRRNNTRCVQSKCTGSDCAKTECVKSDCNQPACDKRK